MQSFCDAFSRNPDGSWMCVAPATIKGPHTHIEAQPGTVYRRGTRGPASALAAFLDIEDTVRKETAALIARLRRRRRRT